MTPHYIESSITAIRRAAIERLQAISSSPALDVDMLLGEVLGVDRAYLLTHDDQLLTDEQRNRFAGWVERATNGEPIAYIIGRRGFYDLEFVVTHAVLIPRPETELLLEQALAWAKGKPRIAAVDAGTGSGALAVTLAKYVQQAQVYATDISPAALDVARRNAKMHDANVMFLHGDLLSPLIERGIRVDLVMANLPYIASDEVPTLAVSRHEPRLALDGGADGLDLIRRLLAQIPQVCNPNALILLEIGAGQGAAALALVQQRLSPQSAEVLQDYAGLDRIMRVVI